MEKRESRKPGFILAAIVIGVIIALVMAEIIVRVFDLAPGLTRVSTNIHRLANNPTLKYELAPFTFEKYEAVNGQGRRDFHYPEKKGQSVFRIAVIGDSVALGWGVNVWNAHPNMLEYYLNRFGPEKTTFEVWNFGVRGYGIGEEVACLKEKVLPIKPDLVIQSYSLNDPDPYSVDLAWALSKMEWKDEKYLQDLEDAWQGKASKFLYDHCKLFTFVRYRYLSMVQHQENKKAVNEKGRKLIEHEKKYNYTDRKEKYFHSISDQFWPTIEKGFNDLGQISRKNGFPIVIALCPALDDLLDYKYMKIHKKVKAEAGKNGLLFLDLLSDFQHAATMWPEWELAIDFQHPNAAGHRVFARGLADYLASSSMLGHVPDEFHDKLFDSAVARKYPDLKYFEDKDMFFVEIGLNNIILEDDDRAIEALQKAHELNPENPLPLKALRHLLAETKNDQTASKVKALLNSPAFRY